MDSNVIPLPERRPRRKVVRRTPARVVDIAEAATARDELAYRERIADIAVEIRAPLDEADALKARPKRWQPIREAL